MATMVLGGLWHGAGWNFVLWGFLHGVYLVINHGWASLSSKGKGSSAQVGDRKPSKLGIFLTFIVVVIAWVPFRSTDFATTVTMLKGMFGMNGISLTPYVEPFLSFLGNDYLTFNGFAPITNVSSKSMTVWVPIGLFIVWKLPNSQEIMAKFSPAWDSDVRIPKRAWMPTRRNAVIAGFVFAAAVISFKQNSPFLYFQF
jgi:alginate O-acetyltransferase complex protein AlgI